MTEPVDVERITWLQPDRPVEGGTVNVRPTEDDDTDEVEPK